MGDDIERARKLVRDVETRIDDTADELKKTFRHIPKFEKAIDSAAEDLKEPVGKLRSILDKSNIR